MRTGGCKADGGAVPVCVGAQRDAAARQGRADEQCWDTGHGVLREQR